VDVLDGLAAFVAGVDDDAESFGEVGLGGEFVGGEEHVSKEGFVRGGGVGEGADVFARDDEQVRGRLRRDVGEGDDAVVFIDALGGNFSGGDFAEEAVHREIVGWSARVARSLE
jgi:hypothetical protein